MIEAQILNVLLKHQAWLDYAGVLDWPALKAQTPEVYRVLLCLKKWHETKEGDLGILELPIWFSLQYPGMKDKEKELYKPIFEQAQQAEVRDELIVQYLQQMKDTQTRRTLAVMAIDDKVPNEKVIAQMQLLSAAPQELIAPDEFVTTDIFDLVALEESIPTLMWRLECLNKSIGPIKKGVFGVIFARVETGKTAMWVSEVSNFIGQITDDEHIVVFFNEENGTDVMWRLYTAVTGLTGNELEADLKKAKKLFYDAGGQKIKFVDRARQTPTSIYKTLDSLNPRAIIIDNLDKIKGFQAERKDMELGSIYEWARATAKTYAPVIGVSQANADGYNTKWITELDMANSKTAKQAELDFLIGIGKTNEAGYEYVRYINIPKNKRKHNRYANEKDRHGKFVATLIPELSLYKDN